ncbi:MAG: UDP-N-acetylglucosamine--N-acetylmuramyl-(pentapeptide) pyrophosphoryl-undecaprenol N-acetylglucosamine transferase [Candidatus Melainabacteria bacterium]|nr:UDP-N-acetylglucosamine--N-acetylmuramyl-(pentapeptide) pyrophosphoryl-undecaprenol N-acetylglucosamine transferase [Candidatus Melainabacteria bacterium]
MTPADDASSPLGPSSDTERPSRLRVLVTGGGTGGHVYPALAVCERLERDPEVESILYVGNAQGFEQRVIPETGLAFESVVFTGMPRGFKPWALLQWMLSIPQAVLAALRILNRFSPHVVLGTGGYVSAPVLMAARLKGIPYLVHEPDAWPGLVNRLMSYGATMATGAFEVSGKRLHAARFEATGNPLRASLTEQVPHATLTTDAKTRQQQRAEALAALHSQLAKSSPANCSLANWSLANWSLDRPILLVTGGSQGAQRINRALAGALPALLESLQLQVIHQTGHRLYEDYWRNLPEALQQHPNYCVQPYYANMSLALSLADVAVCRAGSLTLAELYLAQVPSILVPYPYAAANHQYKNAQTSLNAGASWLLPDAECTSERMLALLTALLNDPAQLAQMRQACRLLAKPGAAERLVVCLKALARW